MKTARYDPAAVERDLLAVLQAAEDATGDPGGVPPGDYLRAWYHPEALGQLLRYRGVVCAGCRAAPTSAASCSAAPPARRA